MCLYRGPDGLMCAAGCLIEDEYYSPKFEGKGAHVGEISNALISSGVPMNKPEVSRLVQKLQAAHDNIGGYRNIEGATDFMSFFPSNARVVAEFYNLSTAVLDNHPALTKKTK